MNARSEVDVDEKKIMNDLLKAGGSNYDAGAKQQGHDSSKQSLKELHGFHQNEQVRANKTETFSSKGINVIDKDKTNQFWQKDREVQTQPKQQPTKTQVEINSEETQKVCIVTNPNFALFTIFISTGSNNKTKRNLNKLQLNKLQLLLVEELQSLETNLRIKLSNHHHLFQRRVHHQPFQSLHQRLPLHQFLNQNLQYHQNNHQL